MSNLAKRVGVAIVGIPIILFLTIKGGWWFFAFVVVVGAVALHELYTFAGKKIARPNAPVGIVAGVALSIPLMFTAGQNTLAIEQRLLAVVGILLILTLVTLATELWRGRPHAIANVGVTVFGVLYVSLGMTSLLDIRSFFTLPWVHQPELAVLPQWQSVSTADEWGWILVIITFVSIWICDSAAYFVGIAIGKHKLFPRVSPKKSWEGAIAGFIGATLAFTLLAHFFLPVIPTVHAIVLGLLIGVADQIGDLAESLLKRDAGVKDSSHIIPGHGGALDRFDSILFVAPIVLLYLSILWLVPA